ncbi:aminotransferase class IV [Streptomyces somaliensis]|uniref:aminotransferase class IV n=1 Tax=Streptomyces somaliensis TaxID=78355 RepID=UPI0020CEC55D|nr:aminotransferase class IV [Streptomyces somaliensis]MCP9943857.1 aminotransferase class IV [Streptomyces somaliensis]MCP9962896.1 aminotransferase class IV [Streptomyces somaliensis]MCP9975744.1 aminotransferase class IV [Streptomyces somaliensis]
MNDQPPYPHVHFGGRWVTRAEARVPIGSLAMRYGLSVFEGIRLYAPATGGLAEPFLLADHINRMAASLRAMRFPDPGLADLPGIIDELITRNAITGDAYVRVAATPLNSGTLAEAASPQLSVTATPMGRKQWLAEERAMALCISNWQRGSAAVHPPAAKNIANYAGPRLAWLEAKEAGYDGCVLTNRHGRLSEAPTAALFLVRDGVLLTPALTEDVLPSITRSWVIGAAHSLEVPVEETGITREDAYRADEAFLCGTGLEFAPVASFDGRPCRCREQRPLTRQLIAAYFQEARGGPPPAKQPCPARAPRRAGG